MPDREAAEAPGAKRRCLRCLLRDLAEEDQRELRRYLDAIKPTDRAPAAEADRRLEICRACEKLVDATCGACGCYVEFRAAVKDGRCPKKKW